MFGASSTTDAMREALASAPTDTVILHTLQVHHDEFANVMGSTGTDLYIVNDADDMTGMLETGSSQTFTARPFEINFPSQDERQTPNASVTIDNTDLMFLAFIRAVEEDENPVEVTYRPFLSDDLMTSQVPKPLKMNLANINFTTTSLTADLVYRDFESLRFPSIEYNRRTFPGLG